jgi:hypothetical protein
MLIRFQRDGGLVAQLKLTLALDTSTLPPDERSEIEDMVASSGFMDLPPVLEGDPEARDAYTFTVTVEDGDRSHTVVVADSAVPDSLRPLITRLTERAKQQRRADSTGQSVP